MFKMKTVVSFVLAVILIMITNTNVFALSNDKTDSATDKNVVVTSPEFPDAYIITEVNGLNDFNIHGSNRNDDSDNKQHNGQITATVFVEEVYEMVDGELAVTSSRLLSKREVDAIGIDNFDNLQTQTLSPITTQTARNSRGKLTITFDANGVISGNSSEYDLEASANWDGFDVIYDSEDNPAVGKDFIGFAWAGDFDTEDLSAAATWNGGGDQDIYLSDAVPNAGAVWDFEEYANAGGKYSIYVDQVDLNATIFKNSMTGDGNTAQAVLKYIHTYQSSVGNISITAGPSGVGAGFTLNSTPKQWNIVCIMNGLYY